MPISTADDQLGDCLGAPCNVNRNSQKQFAEATGSEHPNSFKARGYGCPGIIPQTLEPHP